MKLQLRNGIANGESILSWVSRYMSMASSQVSGTAVAKHVAFAQRLGVLFELKPITTPVMTAVLPASTRSLIFLVIEAALIGLDSCVPYLG